MKNLFIIMLALLPALAQADASVSSDAGRSIDNGQSDTIKRDKSLSTDKSAGNRTTATTGHEKSTEKSKSKTSTKKVGNSAENSKSASVDININGLLLREFTARYERNNSGTGKAGEYFGICKPLTRSIVDYPVFYWGSGGDGSGFELNISGLNEGRERANNRMLTISSQTKKIVESAVGQVPDHNNLIVSRYVQCRVTASYWIAEAGERAASKQVSTEAEVRDRIINVFTEMDSDASVFQRLRQRARVLWEQESCSSWLEKIYDFHAPKIQCGVFTYEGNTFTVENRETLSESSIDGHSYKITVSAQASNSVASDDSVSSDDKVSTSDHKGDSTEKFKESKKTASMNKSKNLDNNSSSKVDRSTGNSVNAAPKD